MPHPPVRPGSAGNSSLMKPVSDIDKVALFRELSATLQCEVRHDPVSRALYSTDASVYQMMPLGVVVPRSRDDIVQTLTIARRYGCPITMRGGGTSQSGQAVGDGLQVDTSKHFNRILEVNPEERWCRVEPGIVLGELNHALARHGLKFAPDVSTASRATIGGMMSNNSSGTRSVLYGKTIDHVLDQEVLFADGTIRHLGPLSPGELDKACEGTDIPSAGYRLLRRLGPELAAEVADRFPKVMRRVMGYNLDAFIRPDLPFDLTRLMVGSEGTLGIVLEARLNLVPLPRARSVMVIQFATLHDALAATPAILPFNPSAVEVMDRFILDHTRENAALRQQRESFIQGDPGAILCVEFYAETPGELPSRMKEVEASVRARQVGDRFLQVTDTAEQARVWGLRESSLGLSMAMKDDNKSLSFVEDTAVAPERLADYIGRFLEIIESHGTRAGVYAHASVGCLHVRPVVNMKTEEGVRRFEAIADDISTLVLEFGGALSGEHGDGMVRSPFIRKMFGDRIYEAFREIKHTFDPEGILNPGKIVDSPPLTANLRYGAGYQTPAIPSFFDYSAYGGWGQAVEMCSGLGVCRKTLTGTMCPSYMATREESHSTRGRANVLRLAISGQLGPNGLGEKGLSEALDLCLECRACKTECPVGVDVGRFKSEFLASRWERGHPPLGVRLLGNARGVARLGSLLAPASNVIAGSRPARWLNEHLTGVDRRRSLPRWTWRTLEHEAPDHVLHDGLTEDEPEPAIALLFNDTWTNFSSPEIGLAAIRLIESGGGRCRLAPNRCCGRPLISQGLLSDARQLAVANARALYPAARRGIPLLFCEPSCLSAIAEDAPDLLRGEDQRKARVVATTAMLVEDYLEEGIASGRLRLAFRSGPSRILLHGHCHQKAMSRTQRSVELLERIRGARVELLDSGCCGMAGSFGYLREHYEVSRAIGERVLLPQARRIGPEERLVASGTSCRNQIRDFAETDSVHPVILLDELAIQ